MGRSGTVLVRLISSGALLLAVAGCGGPPQAPEGPLSSQQAGLASPPPSTIRN
jgi:hypothetical protein